MTEIGNLTDNLKWLTSLTLQRADGDYMDSG